MKPYVWNFGFLAEHWGVILAGLGGALKLALTVLAFGLVLGGLVGMARTSRSKALRALGTAFVELFRNIPAVVQVFWFYYVLPIVTGAQASAFTASAMALTLYSSAYLAEIYRSGIETVDRGQWDAGRAIGLSDWHQMRYIVLPQALRRMIPAFTNQIADIVKLTTIASTVAYAEVLYYAKLLSNQEFRPLEAYTVAAALLIAILLPFGLVSARLERHLQS